MKTLALSELRRIAERFTRVPMQNQKTKRMELVSARVPWRVTYVSASNGDVIRNEECVTLAVFPQKGARLVQFTASGQTRRLRDCCILQANDFMLRI